MKKRKILIFGISTIVIIIFCLGLEKLFISNNFNFEKKTEKFERVLNEKIKIVDDIFTEANEIIKVKKIKGLFADKNFSKKTETQNITLLIFQTDTLKYWSNNNVSFDEIFSSNFDEDKIIFLKNGWYFINEKTVNNYREVSLILIKNEYSYENDYLSNSFKSDFDFIGNAKINTSLSKYNIYENSKFLFSIQYEPSLKLTETQNLLIALFYLLAFLSFIVFLYYLHVFLLYDTKFSKYTIWVYFFDLIIVRFLLFYFKIPHTVYTSELFGPGYFAQSEFLPSFGDLFINTILFLIIAIIIFKKVRIQLNYQINKPIISITISVISISVIILLFIYITYLIKSLILDSTISFELTNIFTLNFLSIAGVFIISSLFISFYLISEKICTILFRNRIPYLITSIVFILILIICILLNGNQLYYNLGIATAFLFIISYGMFSKLKSELKIITHSIFIIVIFSIFSTIVLYKLNLYKENEKRISLARRLSESNDYIAEYAFEKVKKQIVNDKNIIDLLKRNISDEVVSNYIVKNYFNGFWDKYKVQLTICDKNDSLRLEAQNQMVDCKDFFISLIKNIGKETKTDDLFVLNYETGGNNYIAPIYYNNDSIGKTIFIELNSKFIPKGLGYPELLIDKKIFINANLGNYSYAKYKKKELIEAYGSFYYSINYNMVRADSSEIYFFDYNGYNHLLFNYEKNKSLIITKKSTDLLEIAALFSYMFFYFSIYFLIFIVLINIPFRKTINVNFKNRLQVSMISVILISFLAIGIAVYYYINDLNNKKNIEVLSEKSLSILIELQDKLNEYDSFNSDFSSYIDNYLIKFSNIFFTDINIFNVNGELMYSSRPQMINEGLLNNYINTTAYYQMYFRHKSFYIQKEKIGNLEYYSAYIPIYINGKKLFGYMNLPYFAKEGELKKELSSFLMTFVNIYAILIWLSITIALIFAARITKPLKLISEKISNITFGKTNEKIVWNRTDEIGVLVKEYNRMLDELAISAEKLAKSERESAWREVAQEVAHEIKNPLTPIRLNIEFLEMAWKQKSPDFDVKIESITKAVNEQIDNLARIAEEFSSFAKMPSPIFEEINVLNNINSVKNLFEISDNITINISYDKNRKYIILGDKNQINRVFNNLIKNAIQALGNRTEGLIDINIKQLNKKIQISIFDNGVGISENDVNKIFTPSFSTKTSGMGIGLYMVKQIVEAHKGRIWFESSEGFGTTFYLEFSSL